MFTAKLSLQLLTYREDAPATALRPRKDRQEAAPVDQPLQTQSGAIVAAHTLVSNMRDSPWFRFKRQKPESAIQDGGKDGGRIGSVQRQCHMQTQDDVLL